MSPKCAGHRGMDNYSFVQINRGVFQAIARHALTFCNDITSRIPAYFAILGRDIVFSAVNALKGDQDYSLIRKLYFLVACRVLKDDRPEPQRSRTDLP